jgi:large subunit ribosomal protein L9
MKVIMLKDVRGVGQRGTIIEAKDGYALNFLIPQRAAEQATPDKIAAFEAKQMQDAALHDKQAAALQSTLASLNGARVTIRARATEKGGLFKSITVPDIANAIQEQLKARLADEFIVLEKPLKQMGEYIIELRAMGAQSRVTLSIESL